MATTMQKQVAEKVAEKVRKGEKVSISGIMKEVGYKKSVAKKPNKVTESKAWPALMEEYLPDSGLAQLHASLNEAGRLAEWSFGNKVKDEDIKKMIEAIPGGKLIRIEKLGKKRYSSKTAYFLIPEHMVRKFALEMAYKLKGRFAPEQHEHFFDSMSEDQLTNYIIGKISKKE